MNISSAGGTSPSFFPSLRRSIAELTGTPLFSLWIPAVAFFFLISRSVVAYSNYPPTWDDLYLLHRAICFHNAAYRLNLKAMFSCYGTLSKSPIMTVMTLSWGAAASGETAIPLGLLSLALLIWIVALLAHRAAVSSGASPWVMAAAAASIWFNPFLASNAGAFLSDMLLAWAVLLTLLLIPLELATEPRGWVHDVLRGALWGFVFNIGALTKVTFGFFLIPVVAAVMYIRLRRCGMRSLLATVAATLICLAPSLLVWLLFGRHFLQHAVDASFGGMTAFYSAEALGWKGYLRQYAALCAYGLTPLVFLTAYFIRRVLRCDHKWLRILPVTLILGYLGLCAVSSNHDYRFAIPVMIALPLLCAAVPAGLPGKRAEPGMPLYVSLLLAGILISIPMVGRPDLTYIRYAGALLDRIHRPGAVILIATDDPHLNVETFLLAAEVRSGLGLNIGTLVYDIVLGHPLDYSLHRMDSADYILFKKGELMADPEWANKFAATFHAHAAEIGDQIDAPNQFMETFKVRH